MSKNEETKPCDGCMRDAGDGERFSCDICGKPICDKCGIIKENATSRFRDVDLFCGECFLNKKRSPCDE